jgi:hypothetical protein
VHVTLKSDSQLPELLPTGLRLVHREGDQCHLVWQGPADRLQQFLMRVELEHLVVEPPSLEEVFMNFYREGNDELA